jgi:RNA polymerase sigma factor (sigma-70 family)
MNPKPPAVSPFQYESDEVIWNGLKNSNKEAFATIYYRFFKVLLQKGLKISGDRELVKDCIHDLFLEIWETRMNLAIPLSVKAYLLASLLRKIVRKLRKIRSQQAEMDKLSVVFVSSKEDQIITEQQMIEQQYKVCRAIDLLTRRQKEVIQLKFYSNLSYEEIAGRMNISTDSIYNLVSKAICNLHKDLTKETQLSNNLFA